MEENGTNNASQGWEMNEEKIKEEFWIVDRILDRATKAKY
jgi:hypothetical protein